MGKNIYNLPHGSLLHLQKLDCILLVKNMHSFSVRNALLACTFVVTALLSCSIDDEHGRERTGGHHAQAPLLLVPAWLHAAVSSVRPYPSWGAAGKLHNPLFELLQLSLLYSLLKWWVGNEVSFLSFLLPDAPEAAFQRRAKRWLQNSHCF